MKLSDIYQQGKLFAEQPYLVFLPPPAVDVHEEEYEEWNEAIEMTTRSRVTWVCHVINIEWGKVYSTNEFSEGVTLQSLRVKFLIDTI